MLAHWQTFLKDANIRYMNSNKIRFPMSSDDLKKVYDKYDIAYDRDICSSLFSITCNGNDNFSDLIKYNTLEIFGYKNILFVKVSRFGPDPEIMALDGYKHSSFFYYKDQVDLTARYFAKSGSVLDSVEVTVFDRKGNPIHQWSFNHGTVRMPLNIVFTEDQGSLIIPIEFSEGTEEISISRDNIK